MTARNIDATPRESNHAPALINKKASSSSSSSSSKNDKEETPKVQKSISAPKTSSSIQIAANPHAAATTANPAAQEFNDVMLPVIPVDQQQEKKKKKVDENQEKVKTEKVSQRLQINSNCAMAENKGLSI